MQHWMIEKSVARYEQLLASELDDDARAVMTRLLALERAKLMRLSEEPVELAA